MEKGPPQKRSRVSLWVLGISVLVCLTVLLLLQTSNLWKDFAVDSVSDTLLLYALSSLNFIAFVIFAFIFLRSIIKLARERRAFQLGSRIKTRLLLYFAAISLLPIIAMAGFSYLFMNRAIERWFIQIPENVVRLPIEVENQAIQVHAENLDKTARMIAATLEKNSSDTVHLQAIAEAGNLTLIELISNGGQILGRSERQIPADQKAVLDRALAGIRSGHAADAGLRDGRGFDAAAAVLSDGRRVIIVPDLAIDRGIGQMVDSSLTQLDRLKEQQVVVQQVGFLTLGVLTFLLIFASSWTAFYIARGLTVPIKALAVGADEIAQGNLSHRVDVLAEDELALLVTTFNQMSAKLEENSAELSERRRYIETVLQSLPTGVISFDAEGRISTINPAAKNILKLEDGDFTRLGLDELVNAENKAILERLISRAKRVGHASEQTVLQRENANGSTDGEMPVALTASALPDSSGAVLVIEDLSELISAQRASAWQEVARRMAHEIKNPLTPIQLSAERIAKRFADAETRRRVDAGSEPTASAGGFIHSIDDLAVVTSNQTAKVVKEGTDTILREVRSLKSMVDEFSRFARLPNARLEKGDLNDILEQVAALYEERADQVMIETQLTPDLPNALLDGEQMKRVFVNLIENAIEAFDPEQTDKTVTVRSRYDVARDIIIAEVADNGRGIPPGDLQKLFQPYFSTKERETGIGLAIVQRIVTEHNGAIKAVANQPKGAKLIIELPV